VGGWVGGIVGWLDVSAGWVGCLGWLAGWPGWVGWVGWLAGRLAGEIIGFDSLACIKVVKLENHTFCLRLLVPGGPKKKHRFSDVLGADNDLFLPKTPSTQSQKS